MKIQPPVTQKANPFIGFLIFVFILALAGLIFLTLFYYKSAASVPTLVIQSFAGKVEVSPDQSAWTRPHVGDTLKPFQYIRTGEDGEIDLKFGKTASMRLKENGGILFLPPAFYSKAQGRIHLTNGSLLASNVEEKLEITVSEFQKTAPKGFFADRSIRIIQSEGTSYYRVFAAPEKNTASVSVLRGKITIGSLFGKQTVTLKEMQSLEINRATASPAKKTKISQAEWKETREAYEILGKSAAQEAIQQDLAKKAGNFFNYVIDHGTFYQQKFGWCEREFFAPQDKSPVYLQTTYDVFPTGSWVGVYMKTRDLDLSKFKTFKVEARRMPDRPHPENIRLEFKAKYQVIQAFAVKKLATDWETIEFPLHVSKSTQINELTFIFSNDKVGSKKSGGVQFRNFVLIEADVKPEAPVPSEEDTTALKAPAAVAQNQSAITKLPEDRKESAASAKAPADTASVEDLEEL